MKDLVADLRAMPKPSSIEVREPIELPDREFELAADFVGVEVSRSKIGWLQYNGRGRMR